MSTPAPRKSLGQHFLVDDNVVGRLIELAARTGEETVVEVGPGIGTLTAALCAHASPPAPLDYLSASDIRNICKENP